MVLKTTDTDISPDVEAAIEEIVRADLGRFGVERVEVVPVEDWTGEPAIRVLIHYDSPDAEPDVDILVRLIHRLNDRLHAMKERRFAYVSHVMPERRRRARARG